MNKQVLLDKLHKFCPPWIKQADPSLPVEEIFQQTIRQVLPGLLHVTIEYIDHEKIIGTVPYHHQTANVLGYMHGGTIFSTGDTLAGTFLWANSEAGQYAVTTHSEIKYLKPFKEGVLKCVVVEKSRQNRIVTLEAVFMDDDKQTISVMTVDYLLMKADYPAT